MANPIGWCDDTWVPYTGCDKVSPGCENCYALTMSNRLAHMPATKKFYGDAVEKTKSGKINWTGQLTANLSQVGKPLGTKKPTIFFVSSMSDIFHKDMTFEMIDDLYDIMNRCPQHTFKVLTKRSAEMFLYYEWKKQGKGYKFETWPLPNVQLGVSAENQKYYDERIPRLLNCAAVVRFVSCEPLLGAIKLQLSDYVTTNSDPVVVAVRKLLHQVIVGGESGHGARPMNPNWARDLRDQCKSADVSFWFKQHGEYREVTGATFAKSFSDFEEFIDGATVVKVGTKKAGHLLDGKEYFEQPKSPSNGR